MDSITQAVLGASIGEVLLGKKIGNKAPALGAMIATIPDLDILLTPLYDPLEKISLHRGLSHSILFCFIGAFLFSWILGNIKWTGLQSYKDRWMLTFLALFTHVMLDTFTAYGTQLFLPITDWRVGFDSISIIDPVYTVPLLGGLFLSLFLSSKSVVRKSLPNKIGLILSSVYLLFTLVNKQHVNQEFKSQLADQNIQNSDLLTVPVKIGYIHWYGVAKNSTSLHIGQYSVLGKNSIQFQSFPINDHLLEKMDDKLVDRMKWFAKGFYTVAESNGKIRIYNMQCDMQGVRQYGDYSAPTAFYFEITPGQDGVSYDLNSGMHPSE
ncbi:MAG: metal-dependent hydrolase [Saprospiraceae bacterium]|nr:metal-dependent hydrolase [Saprospiraceae bacterium]